MTTMISVRLPDRLARELKAKTRAARTSPSAVLRQAAASYVRKPQARRSSTPLQQHIDARAGSWDGYVSGVELLLKTRP